MKTTYVIQKRHPSDARPGGFWKEWHDRPDSSPYFNQDQALKETRRLILNAGTVQYRLVERTDREVPL